MPGSGPLRLFRARLARVCSLRRFRLAPLLLGHLPCEVSLTLVLFAHRLRPFARRGKLIMDLRNAQHCAPNARPAPKSAAEGAPKCFAACLEVVAEAPSIVRAGVAQM